MVLKISLLFSCINAGQMHTMKSTILLSLVPIGLKLDDNALFEFDDDDDDIFSQKIVTNYWGFVSLTLKNIPR